MLQNILETLGQVAQMKQKQKQNDEVLKLGGSRSEKLGYSSHGLYVNG